MNPHIYQVELTTLIDGFSTEIIKNKNTFIKFEIFANCFWLQFWKKKLWDKDILLSNVELSGYVAL